MTQPAQAAEAQVTPISSGGKRQAQKEQVAMKKAEAEAKSPATQKPAAEPKPDKLTVEQGRLMKAVMVEAMRAIDCDTLSAGAQERYAALNGVKPELMRDAIERQCRYLEPAAKEDDAK